MAWVQAAIADGADKRLTCATCSAAAELVREASWFCS
jgi:hypothetical protein